MSQSEQDRRIDYVEFSATDIEATKSFYHSVFGWAFQDFGPDYTSFSDGRLGGGFSRVEANQGGGPLVVIYAVDLEAIESQVPGIRRNDCPPDLRVSRRPTFSLCGSERERTGCLV